MSEVWSLLLNKVLKEGVCWRYGVYCSTRYCRRECVGGMESIAQQGTHGSENFHLVLFVGWGTAVRG